MTEPESTRPPSRAGTEPHETADPGIPEGEEPNTTGTLFIMMVFLMALAGMWGLMYIVLLGR